jgi:hypothetical protein
MSGDIPVGPDTPEERQLLAGDPDLAEFYKNSQGGQYVFCQVQFHLRADLKTIEWEAADAEKGRTDGPAEREAEESPGEGPDSSHAVDKGGEGKVDG